MTLFGDRALHGYLDERMCQLREEVESEDRNRLLNVNETQYIMYLVEKYRVEPLVFHVDRLTVSSREEMIAAERFPPSAFVRKGESNRKQVITLHLPYSGHKELLSCSPRTRRFWIPSVWQLDKVWATDDEVCFDVIVLTDSPEPMKAEKEPFLNCLKEQAERVNAEVSSYNATLETVAQRAVQPRKRELLRQSKLVEALEIPLRKAENVPDTFAIPITPKRMVIKPEAPDSSYAPEPTIPKEIYSQILKIVSETGIAMERHPSIYGDKGEEPLRDLFLMVLCTHFTSVTGETFNNKGKTDILIQYEGENAFIAECKFWDGIKSYLETINQLLRYLTWRDSKSAILCFVRKEELQPVLDQIESETQKHTCFVKYHGKQSESWFNFEFHLKDDPTRSVHMAVLCFHFPET